MIFEPLTKKLWNMINKEIRACIKAKKERPTVAAVLYHTRSRQYLIITSRKGGLSNPGLVKGGVVKSESAYGALKREIRQELGVSAFEINIKGYGGTYSVPLVHSKNGLAIKRYFVFLVAYSGPLKLAINGELSGYFWMPIEEIKESLGILKETRPEKFDVLMKLFADPSLNKKKKSSTKKPPRH
ncbi:NUDIX hydrolase [Candidatus Kaiserbacteria bacterium]|nr:NUDIX hydrolase [Candidatus Kaiserbacteria bacterium]